LFENWPFSCFGLNTLSGFLCIWWLFCIAMVSFSAYVFCNDGTLNPYFSL